MTTRDALILLPALASIPGSRNSFVLTRKFVDGVLEYAKGWPGRVIVSLLRASEPNTNLDRIEVHPDEVPFELEWLPSDFKVLARKLSRARLVLASLVDTNIKLPEVCGALEVPLVYVSEYSLLTRRQIVRADTSNPLIRWRREIWTMQLENRLVECVRQAKGVQCSGTPTFETYRKINRRALLYFDSRVRSHQVVVQDTLTHRTSELLAGAPLRLAFSGRLIPMKGPDHLPRVAYELKRRGVRFSMNIFGGGSLEPAIHRAIQKLDVHDCVHVRGIFDFHTQLVPAISTNCDLFVCCHRQGDPSCTYLETLSCGTPIVGYDNEALRGLIALCGCGWTVPMDRPDLLAARIAELDRMRPVLAQAAFAARQFAARHTFEKTMRIRIDHMLSCVNPLQMEAKAS